MKQQKQTKRGIKSCLFVVVLLGLWFVNGNGQISPLFANDTLTQANTALIKGRYKDVVKHVGTLIGSGQPKPEVMARALLLRGIAYRHQGKIAQSISDLSNAEWLQKLRGVELRRLYAERALAYEAAGQKGLASKDRALAGSQNLNVGRSSANVKRTINSQGKKVRTTTVQPEQSTTSQFFGGLGNLFGFNNNAQKKEPVETKQKQVASTQKVVEREIPTLESAEAKANRLKTQGVVKTQKQTADLTKTAALDTKNLTKKEGTPSNSAWAAQRVAADKEAQKRALAERAITQKQAIATKPLAQNQPLELNNDQGPIALAPKKTKTQTPQNTVTSFFQNIFGGGQQTQDPPVGAGDDIIAADQVASLEQEQTGALAKKKTVTKRAVQAKRKAKPVKVATKTPVKKAPVKQETRSLYHVQLGVFGEAQAADRFVSRLNSQHKALINGKTAMVVETDLGQSRRQYRVYLGPYRSRQSGVKSCSALKKQGMGCSLVD